MILPRFSYSHSGAVRVSGSISSSSVYDTVTFWVRFNARLNSSFFIDRFRTILQINALKLLGRVGGILFHTLKYVSFTHSSESSSLNKILFAILKHSFPYLISVSLIACSLRAKYNSIIIKSSMRSPPFLNLKGLSSHKYGFAAVGRKIFEKR